MRAAAGRRRGSAIGLACLAASASILVYAIWGAVGLEPLPALPAAPATSATGAHGGERPPAPLAPVLEVVAVDPFHPERRAPGRRYGLADDAPAMADVPTAQLRLTGTALLPDGGGFVLAALGAETPRIVRVGESLGAYRLIRIREGEADFRRAGEDLTLSVLRPGS